VPGRHSARECPAREAPALDTALGAPDADQVRARLGNVT